MISIVIPAFNEEKKIERTLRLLSSYRGSREIIVADDNSTDATVAVARRYADKVALNQGTKRGIAANRNRGAKLAVGEYIVFVDADIYFEKPDEFFKKAESIFRSDRRIVGMTVFIRTEKDGETFADRIIMGFFNRLFLVLNNFFHFGASSGEFQMVRTDAFRKIGGFDENIVAGEDHDMFRRLARIGRTRSERTLTVFNDGRRAHKIGWPKLLWLWIRDTISVFLFKKSASKVWKEVR